MRGLADTSLFIALESGRPVRVDDIPEQLAVSIVTVGELRAGVLSAVDSESRARRLEMLIRVLAMDPVSIDDSVAQAWSELRVRLRTAGKRMPVNDSWIAATAISLGLAIVSQDDDYDDLPGVAVIKV